MSSNCLWTQCRDRLHHRQPQLSTPNPAPGHKQVAMGQLKMAVRGRARSMAPPARLQAVMRRRPETLLARQRQCFQRSSSGTPSLRAHCRSARPSLTRLSLHAASDRVRRASLPLPPPWTATHARGTTARHVTWPKPWQPKTNARPSQSSKHGELLRRRTLRVSLTGPAQGGGPRRPSSVERLCQPGPPTGLGLWQRAKSNTRRRAQASLWLWMPAPWRQPRPLSGHRGALPQLCEPQQVATHLTAG